MDPIAYGSPRARVVLAATIIASGMAFLDGTVVNVALPRIEADLGGGFATLQWVLDAYLLTLGSLVLLGGALGDLLGLRRVFLLGIAGFGVSSVLCGLAPTTGALIVARAAQGAAAALMVPASLAIVSSSFRGADRGRAIGLWSGLSGITTAVGPLVGGLLVDAHPSGWRLVFLLNTPLALATTWLTVTAIPDVPGTRTSAPLRAQLDVLGGVLAVAGLGLLVATLIESGRLPTALTVSGLLAGAVLLAAFVVVERRRERSAAPPPMMPPALFGTRTFSVANAQTFLVYAALPAVMLQLTVALQVGLGWSALAAGAAGVPTTIMLALFSSRVGALLPRTGARPLLTLGPILMAAGTVVLATIRPGASYLVAILPGILLFAAGLTLVVAPITTTALGDVPPRQSGAASGINNAVARIGGLLAIAVVPLLAGLATDAGPQSLFPAYRTGMLICAGLCLGGSVIGWFGYPAQAGRPVRPA